MSQPDAITEDPIEFLGDQLKQVSETYRQLLGQPAPLEYCQEAGRSFRHAFTHYCTTLTTAMEAEDPEDEEEGLGFDEDE